MTKLKVRKVGRRKEKEEEGGEEGDERETCDKP